ncbi:MAG TPA: DUF1440 domain-containing protein [Thermoanaerobaculia bacterium]|nr:DUF1440 domain-containing protein [Thermoanaerobaculia bacterium]
MWKGMMAGALGGLVGSCAMTGLHALWDAVAKNRGAARHPHHSSQRGKAESARQGRDDATVRAADKIFHALGHEPTQREREIAGPALHYLLGIAAGAFYGALVEKIPRVTAGAGIPYGVAVWIGADEIAVPALGLVEKPASAPSVHARSLAAHLLFGWTTEQVRRRLTD